MAGWQQTCTAAVETRMTTLPGPISAPPCMQMCRLCLISLASAQLLRCLLSWYSLSSGEPPSMLGFWILELALISCSDLASTHGHGLHFVL
jgi:hypothetical protein